MKLQRLHPHCVQAEPWEQMLFDPVPVVSIQRDVTSPPLSQRSVRVAPAWAADVTQAPTLSHFDSPLSVNWHHLETPKWTKL